MSYPFNPPFGLRNPHAQTVISSSLRKLLARRVAVSVKQAETQEIFTAADGARLAAWISTQPEPAPAIVIVHGWLGTHNSSYSLCLAQALWHAGYAIVRLNLRDHGGTAHLNPGMFHNGRIDEVVDVVQQLQARFGQLGLAGFSLGGNFVLRTAKLTGIPALAVSPMMDPPASVAAVDLGARVYKAYFVRKWLRALDEKSAAFPDDYDFAASGALDLASVRAMTAHFVERYTDYPSLQAYYDAYTLTGDVLDGTRAAILAAMDDPVVPAQGFVDLPSSLEVTLLPRGGHCAFLDSYRLSSIVDNHAITYFQRAIAGG